MSNNFRKKIIRNNVRHAWREFRRATTVKPPRLGKLKVKND